VDQSLNNYFSFKGRLNRWKYFIYLLPLVITASLPYVTVLLIPTTYLYQDDITTIILLILRISLSVRRLHDLNITGWLLLIQLLFFITAIDLILIIFDLYLLFVPGTKGANKYGDDPLTNSYTLDDEQYFVD